MAAKDVSLETVGLKLLEITQCPVCFESVGISVVQCVRGHGVCAKCKERLTECPVCKGKFTVEASVMLAKIMEQLPKMCVNSKNGCQTLCSHDHQQFCEFRPTKCRVDEKCKWQGPLTQLVNHLQTLHTEIPILTIANGNLHSYSENFFVFQSSFTYKMWLPIVAYDNFFWKRTEVDDDKKMLMVKLYHLPKGKPKYTYYATQSFESGHFKYSHAMKASTDEIEDEFKNGDPYCMSVPFGELFRFFNNSSKLSYTVHVTRME
uniref:RING-type E3 ubiquitin transferase n=1 Tax=Graphocephala atropunctata TaxID=36148 RepID=A0A1B6KQY8_9HEMI